MTMTAASTGSVQLNMSIQSISISISASISTSTATATLTASSASREFWRFPRTERVLPPPAILDMHTNTFTYEHSEGGSSRGAGVSLACPTNCKYLQTAAGKQICVRFLWLLLLFFFLFFLIFFALLIYHSSRDMFVVHVVSAMPGAGYW